MDCADAVIQETIESASQSGLSSRQRNGVIAKAAKAIRQQSAQQIKQSKVGRPSRYTAQIGKEICLRVSEGETLKEICSDMGIAFYAVMDWLDKYQEFKERYTRSRKHQTFNLVEGLMQETKDLGNDRALGVRVRADVVKWYAARINPEQFSDLKRIELKGEVTHTHVHELAEDHKRRIAEAWLLSTQDEDTPGITAETTGPDISALDSAGVREICETDTRVIPKRKRSATPSLPNPDRKAGRKRKVDLDQPIDPPANDS